jgi:hypothetical protein
MAELDQSKDHAQIEMAKDYARRFGYDQVVIIGRSCTTEGVSGGESVCTYGKTNEHATVAAQIGEFLKYRIMKWKRVMT